MPLCLTGSDLPEYGKYLFGKNEEKPHSAYHKPIFRLILDTQKNPGKVYYLYLILCWSLLRLIMETGISLDSLTPPASIGKEQNYYMGQAGGNTRRSGTFSYFLLGLCAGSFKSEFSDL